VLAPSRRVEEQENAGDTDRSTDWKAFVAPTTWI
jgi:hypothetical protein